MRLIIALILIAITTLTLAIVYATSTPIQPSAPNYFDNGPYPPPNETGFQTGDIG